jgi:integrase
MRLKAVKPANAALLLLEGVPVHVVANRLGHSAPAVTLRVYAHVLRVYAHVLRESASGVADVFAGGDRASVC